MARPDTETVLRRLRVALSAIPGLRAGSFDSSQYRKWKRRTILAIENAFGSDSKHVDEFRSTQAAPITIGGPPGHRERYFRPCLDEGATLLESMIEEVREYWAGDDGASQIKTTDLGRDPARVFVVHGRDVGAAQTVARFLERVAMRPIILHEQPNEGRTVIEKFEDHANVGFAVILLTPDDEGRLRAGTRDSGALNPRARQNVLLELGFFLGKLGRERTCAITKGEVEIPSDYKGVVLTVMDDAGAWKKELARELKTAGMDLDLDRLPDA